MLESTSYQSLLHIINDIFPKAIKYTFIIFKESIIRVVSRFMRNAMLPLLEP